MWRRCEVDWVGYFCSASSFQNLEHVAGRQREGRGRGRGRGRGVCVSVKMPSRLSGDNSGFVLVSCTAGAYSTNVARSGAKVGGKYDHGLLYYAQRKQRANIHIAILLTMRCRCGCLSRKKKKNKDSFQSGRQIFWSPLRK